MQTLHELVKLVSRERSARRDVFVGKEFCAHKSSDIHYPVIRMGRGRLEIKLTPKHRDAVFFIHLQEDSRNYG